MMDKLRKALDALAELAILFFNSAIIVMMVFLAMTVLIKMLGAAWRSL